MSSQADVVELDNPHIVAVAGGGRVALASYKNTPLNFAARRAARV